MITGAEGLIALLLLWVCGARYDAGRPRSGVSGGLTAPAVASCIASSSMFVFAPTSACQGRARPLGEPSWILQDMPPSSPAAAREWGPRPPAASPGPARRSRCWIWTRRRRAPSARRSGGLGIACDVSDAGAVEHAVARAREAHGPARICVNCAGIAPAQRIVGRDGPAPLDGFRRVVEVNLIGTFNVMRICAADMAGLDPLNETGERGVIVATASVAAYEGADRPGGLRGRRRRVSWA